MSDRAAGDGDPSRRARPNRTGGKRAGGNEAGGNEAGGNGSGGDGGPPGPDDLGRPPSAVRMQGNEPMVGYVVAVALAGIAAIFLTVTPGARAPHHPSSVGPVVALVLCAVLAASIVAANRVLSGLLAVFASFALQIRYVDGPVVFLRKTGFLIAVVFAVWLTFHQASSQRALKLGRAARRRDQDPGA